MKTGIAVAIVIAIIAFVGCLVPLKEVAYTETYSATEPLSYQVTSFVNKEQVKGDPRSLSKVAFSHDLEAIQKALQEAYPPLIEYPACRVVVQNTDTVSGIFTVHFTFYLPGDQDTKDVTFELVPDELGMASYRAKGVNFDEDEWSWEYDVTPDTKTVTKERTLYKKVTLLDYLLHY